MIGVEEKSANIATPLLGEQTRMRAEVKGKGRRER